MPISMLDRSANGTSLVTNSHSRIAKLHMSADRRLISSGFFCRAGNHKEQLVWVSTLNYTTESALCTDTQAHPSWLLSRAWYCDFTLKCRICKLMWFVIWIYLTPMDKLSIGLHPYTIRTQPSSERKLVIAKSNEHFSIHLLIILLQKWQKATVYT